MKKSYLFCLFGIFLSFIFLGCCKSTKKSVYDFNLISDAIKKKIGIEEESSSLYFQKVWVPIAKSDTNGVIPELFVGEFISSHRKIEFSIPTAPLEHYSMRKEYDEPEDILFRLEDKQSDTIFYYSVHNYGFMSQNMNQIVEPIACITPNGEIVALGEYLISEAYLNKKITHFLEEIMEKAEL